MGDFVDIARDCAPQITVETVAAIVSLESAFKPFAIRIDTGRPLNTPPETKAEAIATATALIAEGHQLGLGLSGLDAASLNTLGLSVAGAFDTCLNLKAAATLLDGYYRVAINAGAKKKAAETHMLNTWYGKGDAAAGESASYDQQVRRERTRLSPLLNRLVIDAAPHQVPFGDAAEADGVSGQPPSAAPHSDPVAKAPPTPSWDVYGSNRGSSVFVWTSPQPENRQ